jgi:hypothetical protein
VLTGVSFGITGLRVGAFFPRSSIVNSVNGDFAAELPQIVVQAVDKAGTATLVPMQVELYPSELIDEDVDPKALPEAPYVPPERARYLDEVLPEQVRAGECAQPCEEKARVLAWESSGEPLRIEYSGTVLPFKREYEKRKSLGPIQLSIGLALGVPALAYLVRGRVQARRARRAYR